MGVALSAFGGCFSSEVADFPFCLIGFCLRRDWGVGSLALAPLRALVKLLAVFFFQNVSGLLGYSGGSGFWFVHLGFFLELWHNETLPCFEVKKTHTSKTRYAFMSHGTIHSYIFRVARNTAFLC